MSDLAVEFVDAGRYAQCRPNPDFPAGIDVDLGVDADKTCSTLLPYPAPRCGIMVVRCSVCGLVVGLTVAGRPDDPRSVRVKCKPIRQ